MMPSKEDRFWMKMLVALLCITIGVGQIFEEEDARLAAERAASIATPAECRKSAELVYTVWHHQRLVEGERLSAADLYIIEPEGEDPLEAEKIEAALVERGYFREDVPLDYFLQDFLRTACEKNGVPWAVALGLIEVESNFDIEAVNATSGCYGLCQLNPKYFPAGLTPWENIEAGIAYLGGQLQRYGGDLRAALTAYNAGYDTGNRDYAGKVLAAAERWRED